MEFPNRKPNRLTSFDYNQNGIYHVTLCTNNKQCILGKIEPGDLFTPPVSRLSTFGNIVDNHIQGIQSTYGDITIEKYVIMPNHVHMLISIHSTEKKHTAKFNEKLPFLISTLKRLSNKDAGVHLWQRGYFDHIIRDQKDYQMIWKYIDENPAKWIYDDYYIT